MSLPLRIRREKRARMMPPKETAPIECKGHRDFVAGHECVISDCHRRPIVAHHLKIDGLMYGAGKGLKPDDRRCVSLCHKHHDELHSMSEPAFWDWHGVDPEGKAAEFVERSPYRHKFRRESNGR